jgi:hypothetical protein
VKKQIPSIHIALQTAYEKLGELFDSFVEIYYGHSDVVYGGLAEIDRQMSFGPTARFRLLVRHGMLEFYLDDILFHIRTLGKPATGKIGIVGTPGSVTDMKVWQMSL